MKTLYALIVTILLAGAAAPEAFAQRSGRNTGGDDRTERRGGILGDIFGSRDDSRDRDGDGDYDSNDRRIEQRERDRRDRDYDDWDDDDRYDRRGKKGKGPKFCENGQGHPVHGWEWCEDKGYGDRRYERRNRRYEEDRSLGDIIFGERRRTTSRRRLSGSSLEDMLGRRAFQRLDSYRRAEGFNEPLSGYWASDGLFQIDAGSTPFARLSDRNGDRRVDSVQINRLR